MKIPRIRRISAACALLVVTGGVAALMVSGLQMHSGPRAQSTHAADVSRSAASPEQVTGNHNRVQSKTRDTVELRLDHSISLAPAPSTPPRAHSEAASGRVDARAADDFVENDTTRPPLNLRLPPKFEIAAGPTVKNPTGSSIPGSEPSSTPRVVLGTASTPQPRPNVESFSLFNPDYGLRGFMKQGWINQHVAFQGGLGLDDDRIDKTQDDDFRDNIAVGMGLIVAF